MNMLKAAPLIQALMIFASCVTTATIAHYSESWALAYDAGGVFAIAGAVITHIAVRGEIA